jgi:hypothetical protein
MPEIDDSLADDPVWRELLSEQGFPASREKCRENPIFAIAESQNRRKSARRIDSSDQIPYASEQGKLLV